MKKTVYIVKPKKDEEVAIGYLPIQSALDALVESKRILNETMEPAIITELVVENDKVVSHRKVKLDVIAEAV